MLVQKYGDAVNTQQVGRSERNEIGDLLSFNTVPVDSENPAVCQSIWPVIDKERKSYE